MASYAGTLRGTGISAKSQDVDYSMTTLREVTSNQRGGKVFGINKLLNVITLEVEIFIFYTHSLIQYAASDDLRSAIVGPSKTASNGLVNITPLPYSMNADGTDKKLLVAFEKYELDSSDSDDILRLLREIEAEAPLVFTKSSSMLSHLKDTIMKTAKRIVKTRLSPYDRSRLKGIDGFSYFVRFVDPDRNIDQTSRFMTGFIVHQSKKAKVASLIDISQSRNIEWLTQIKFRQEIWTAPVLVAIRRDKVNRTVHKMSALEKAWTDLFAYPSQLHFELRFDEFFWTKVPFLGGGANGIAIETVWKPSNAEMNTMQQHEQRLWRTRKHSFSTGVSVRVALKLTDIDVQTMQLIRMEYGLALAIHTFPSFEVDGVVFDDSYITPCYGYVVYLKWYGLVMKLMVRGTMQNVLRQNRPLAVAAKYSPEAASKIVSSARSIHMLMQVMHGLAFLHHHDIIHGDLKTANVLVDENGNCCIADLGALAIINKPTLNMGTPAYTPVGERDMGKIITRTNGSRDIYAFGFIIDSVILNVSHLTVVKNALTVLRNECKKASHANKASLTALDVYFHLKKIHAYVNRADVVV